MTDDGAQVDEWIEIADRPTETWRRNSGTPVVRGCFVWFEPSRSQTGEPWLAGYLDYRAGVDRSVPGSNTVTRSFPGRAEGQAWIDEVIARERG